MEEISGTIKLINNLTFYRSYMFSNGIITDENFRNLNISERAIASNTVSKTSSGTATIISVFGNNVALLTAAHIISYPDTIINYFAENGKRSQYIESILIKERQKIYSDLPEGGRLKIIATDDKNDIAIVGNSFSKIDPINFPVFDYKYGNAKKLKWGSFVYVFGYPVHNKMVTRAIVSSPDFDGDGNFLIDASINRGSSGGLVLAIKGEIPNFEVVGIVSSVPADRKFALTPKNPTRDVTYLPGTLYEGEMMIEQIDNVKYGIGRIVSVEKIKKFIKKNESELFNKGYVINLN